MPHKNRTSRILALALLSVSQARAAAPDESAILQAVERVVAEHRVYATCLSLDSMSLRIVLENWDREVVQGAESLRTLNAPAALVARYVVAVNASRLLDKNMTLSAAMAYCQKNEAQVRKFHEFGFSRLGAAIEAAAGAKSRG